MNAERYFGLIHREIFCSGFDFSSVLFPLSEHQNHIGAGAVTSAGFLLLVHSNPIYSQLNNVFLMKILIDNGHGIDTKGKRSPYALNGTKPELDFYEYKWNREIAGPVVDELINRGYDAELIVPEEQDISLSIRAQRVNAICDELGKNNVILVSIHSNAAGNGSEWMTAQGWSAYTSPGQTSSDKLAEHLYKAAEEILIGKKIRTDCSDGDKDWESNLYILKKTKCAAVLTENFFYDNPEDCAYLLSDEGKEAIIKVHVEGIISYLKSIE